MINVYVLTIVCDETLPLKEKQKYKKERKGTQYLNAKTSILLKDKTCKKKTWWPIQDIHYALGKT